MKAIRQKSANVAASLVLFSLASTANAETLSTSFGAQPFLDTSLGGTTVAARPELAGTVLEDDIQPYSFSGMSGTVQNRVVRETATGTLDFYWRIKVDPPLPGTTAGNAISAFRLGNFGYDEITDADWRIDGLGTAAPYVGRVFNPANRPDGAINFLFSDGLVLPDQGNPDSDGSRFFFLHTDATSYSKTAEYDLLDRAENLSPLYTTFAPAGTVPDGGASVSLLAMGLAGVCCTVRRAR